MKDAETARPMGKVIGRQPETPRIVPSRPNPWYGHILTGHTFTVEQLQAVERGGLNPETIERITVRRNATDDEHWWPAGSLPPIFEFECPVLGHRIDGRVRVISPSGMVKLVFADGWTTARRARRKSGRA